MAAVASDGETRGTSAGMPLAFAIGRYFIYAFAGVAVAWVIAFMGISAAINMGWVFEASWGPANVRTVAADLAAEGVRGPQDIPTAYQYLIIDAHGKTLMTDLAAERLARADEMARAALAESLGTVAIEGGGAGLTYAAFPLQDGGACALVSEYLPQWASRDLSGVLPNPQNLMLFGAVLDHAQFAGGEVDAVDVAEEVCVAGNPAAVDAHLAAGLENFRLDGDLAEAGGRARGDEGGLLWNDEEIGVQWPLEEGVDLIISEKDKKWKGLSETFHF